MSSEKEFVKEIANKDEDWSQWYVDVIRKAELADYSPVRGCMVIRPYGFAIWEAMKEGLDRRIKETGHQNAYFPLFIPESLLQKEADHVEGFAPEVAWITKGGNEPLAEPLAVRPTSEAIICSMYSKWIQSYRDLPVLINQWANVVRWEKVTRPFLRTTEFLWQEGHTAHRTGDEAQEEVLRMLAVYQDFVENDMAIPVIPGRKTDREKFAGAHSTYSIEALMQDGKALQAGTSHNLAQHFAKVFDITYLDEDSQLKYVHQTSWGVSTRLVGALIMVHGDNRGLKIPPKLAPVQLVIVPIAPKKAREMVLAKAGELKTALRGAGIRVHLDSREEYSPGYKFNDWEMRGVPLRLEVGPRDIENNQVVLVRRDTGEKIATALPDLEAAIPQLLSAIQDNMLAIARDFMEENSFQAANLAEMEAIISTKRGFVYAWWCGSEECELEAKERMSATIRNIPLDQEAAGSKAPREAKCVRCGKEAREVAIFARAY
ncbi:MAG TPA: proline--tRNA ligase [Bacillota bacterium]|nr:proline--tRNA ligase [Bacillota bacterium]HPZ22005.1 proline--tRNA ligase [Bacillota bacterium]HQD19779.1 proline--tRNA ligase [Bacillota bacterium]